MMKLKSYSVVVAVMGLLTAMISPVSASLFTQDFSSSTVIGSYSNIPPSQNQFDQIINGAGGVGVWGIDAGRLSVTKTGAASAVVRRNTPMVGSPVSAMSFSVDLDFSFTSIANNTAVTLLAFGTNSWGSMRVASAGTDNTWRILNDNSHTFSGVQTLTVFANNSGTAITYTAPDSSVVSLANDTFDVWVGTVKTLSSVAASGPSGNLDGFSVTAQATSGTYTYDNFNIQAIPEPTTLGLFVFSSSAILMFRRGWMK
jgi:hypothetical protein